MERADVALYVAGASAFFTLGGLAWQLNLYRLSGARLVVRLKPALLNPIGNLIRGPERGWGDDLDPQFKDMTRDGWVDLALIEVINIGRTAVSVSNINLDFGSTRWIRRWHRYTIGGCPVPVHEGSTDIAKVRLEPGESVSVFLDVWSMIAAARKSSKETLIVRATAQAASRHAKRSQWRRRWEIGKDDDALWRHDPSTPEVIAFQALWRHVARRGADATYPAWLMVLNVLKPDVTREEIRDALQTALDDDVAAVLPSFDVWHAYTCAQDEAPSPDDDRTS